MSVAPRRIHCQCEFFFDASDEEDAPVRDVSVCIGASDADAAVSASCVAMSPEREHDNRVADHERLCMRRDGIDLMSLGQEDRQPLSRRGRAVRWMLVPYIFALLDDRIAKFDDDTSQMRSCVAAVLT